MSPLALDPWHGERRRARAAMCWIHGVRAVASSDEGFKARVESSERAANGMDGNRGDRVCCGIEERTVPSSIHGAWIDGAGALASTKP